MYVLKNNRRDKLIILISDGPMKIAAVGVTRESTVAPPHLAQSLNPKAGGHANPPAPADGRRHCADIRSPGVGLDYLSMTDKYLSSLDMKAGYELINNLRN